LFGTGGRAISTSPVAGAAVIPVGNDRPRAICSGNERANMLPGSRAGGQRRPAKPNVSHRCRWAVREIRVDCPGIPLRSSGGTPVSRRQDRSLVLPQLARKGDFSAALAVACGVLVVSSLAANG